MFAWFFNFRRLVVRYEYHAEDFQGFVHLAAAIIPQIFMRWLLTKPPTQKPHINLATQRSSYIPQEQRPQAVGLGNKAVHFSKACRAAPFPNQTLQL
jgi:hypothetical protein